MLFGKEKNLGKLQKTSIAIKARGNDQMNSNMHQKISKKYHAQWIKSVYRNLSYFVAPLFVKLGIKANHITISRLFFVGLACFCIHIDGFLFQLIAFISVIIFSFFDALDGTVASLTKKSFLGGWLDPLIDRVGILALFSSISAKIILDGTVSPLWAIVVMSTLPLFIFQGLTKSDLRLKPKFKALCDAQKADPESTKQVGPNTVRSIEFSMEKIRKQITLQIYPHTHNLNLYLGICILSGWLVSGTALICALVLLVFLLENMRVINLALSMDRRD